MPTSTLLPNDTFRELSDTQKKTWLSFEKTQHNFSQQLAKVQEQAFYLEKHLENKLKHIVTEVVSIPARGTSTAINTVGTMSQYLSEGLLIVANVSKACTTAAKYLSKANLHRTEATSYLNNALLPILQTSGGAIIAVGNKMEKLAETLPSKVGMCATIFAKCFKNIGYTIKGMSSLINITAKLDANCIAPALDKLVCGLHRSTEMFHSVAESIREFSSGIHLRCNTLANRVNVKPDSAANKKLDKIASATMQLASNCLWSFVGGTKESSNNVESKVTSVAKRKL